PDDRILIAEQRHAVQAECIARATKLLAADSRQHLARGDLRQPARFAALTVRRADDVRAHAARFQQGEGSPHHDGFVVGVRADKQDMLYKSSHRKLTRFRSIAGPSVHASRSPPLHVTWHAWQAPVPQASGWWNRPSA